MSEFRPGKENGGFTYNFNQSFNLLDGLPGNEITAFGKNSDKILQLHHKSKLQQNSDINIRSAFDKFLCNRFGVYDPKKYRRQVFDYIQDKQELETRIERYQIIKKNLANSYGVWNKYSNEIEKKTEILKNKAKEFINYFNKYSDFIVSKDGSIFTLNFAWSVDINWLKSENDFKKIYEDIINLHEELCDEKYYLLPYNYEPLTYNYKRTEQHYISGEFSFGGPDTKDNAPWKKLPEPPWGAGGPCKIGENLIKITIYGKVILLNLPHNPSYYWGLLKEFEKDYLEDIQSRLKKINRDKHLETTDMYIYVLSNKGIPNLYKIGWTSGLPEDRAEELTTTGVPFPYKVEYKKIFKNADQIEKQIHDHFKRSRVANNREFFEVPLKEIKEYIDRI